MAREFVKAISSYHAMVYPYCHGWFATILAVAAVGLASLWTSFLFFGTGGNERLTKRSLFVLGVAHVLVAVDWIFYILNWGEHPITTLCSLGGIDTFLFLRQSRYGRKVRQGLFILFALAMFVFTCTFILTDLFPVLAIIDFAP